MVKLLQHIGKKADMRVNQQEEKIQAILKLEDLIEDRTKMATEIQIDLSRMRQEIKIKDSLIAARNTIIQRPNIQLHKKHSFINGISKVER